MAVVAEKAGRKREQARIERPRIWLGGALERPPLVRQSHPSCTLAADPALLVPARPTLLAVVPELVMVRPSWPQQAVPELVMVRPNWRQRVAPKLLGLRPNHR